MAISCSECSAPLAPGVMVCPECGSEVGHYDLASLSDERQGTRTTAPQTSSAGPAVIYLACALLLLIVTTLAVVKSHRHHPASAGQSSNQPEAMPITVSHLTADYSADAVAADETYSGKMLEVSGTFWEANPLKRDPTLTSVHLSEDSGTTIVQCVFASQDSGPLAALHKGQQVTIRGLNIGRGNTQHAILRNCQLE